MNKSPNQSFSLFARQCAKNLGKSQRELASALRVSPAYVSQIFSGKKNPPDLGHPRNRKMLRIWAEFLNTGESDLIDLVRHQLHRAPLPPVPRFPKMRKLILHRLDPVQRHLTNEIRAMSFHPAEQRLVNMLAKLYLIAQSGSGEDFPCNVSSFRDFVSRVTLERNFVDIQLCDYFENIMFVWRWHQDSGAIDLTGDSTDIVNSLALLEKIDTGNNESPYRATVPVVGHVSAGTGFGFTDGGYWVGQGFDEVPMPPGVKAELASVLYCVRVRGDSLKDFFGDGALLFIKPESWDDIVDGDLVIFKDRKNQEAFVKKIEFSDENLILKPMNSTYRNIVLKREDLILLERVMAVVF